MATNIEQIFRDFVMNKIKEIEDESQDKSHTDHVNTNDEESHSEKGTGMYKEAPPFEAINKTTDKIRSNNSQDNSARDEHNTKHKKTKKHKKHKSKKKKKKHKGEKESSSETESDGESQVSVKKKKRKKKKKQKGGEKDKKCRSQSGSTSAFESDSEYESKPFCDTNKSSARDMSSKSELHDGGNFKISQELPDIIPKLETAAEKSKASEGGSERKRSSSRSRTSKVERVFRARHSRSSSSKRKSRHRSRSQSLRRSRRSRSRSCSRKSPRRKSPKQRQRSRSRSGSHRRNRRSRSHSARRNKQSRSRSGSGQSRSRPAIKKNMKSRSKSRSVSHHRSSRSKSRSRTRVKRSTPRSQSKSKSLFKDKQARNDEQKIHMVSQPKKEVSSAIESEMENNVKMVINSISIISGGTDDGKIKGSWRPVPFLEDSSSTAVISGLSETKSSVKCITPDLPLDMKNTTASSRDGSNNPGVDPRTETKEEITSVKSKHSHIVKHSKSSSKSVSPSTQRHSKSASRKRSKSRSPAKRRRSRSYSWNSKKTSKLSPSQRKRSKSRTCSRHSQSRSPKRKKSKSCSPDRRKRSRTPDRIRKSRSRHRSRSRSRRSRSHSRRRRGGFRSRMFSQRDRWKREPSHSPVLILRKKRSTSQTRRSPSKSPPRLTELDKEQLLEIAKANAAAMCAKAGMPIPESLRPKTILQLPLPSPNPTSLSLPLPLPVNLPMGVQGMSNMTMNAAMASMTAATMTAALSSMGVLATLPQLAPLPTITNKPPPSATPNLASIEEAKRKVTKQANSYSIKELTEKCKKIAESKEEMAIAKPHVSDDEEDEMPFGGVALKENKGITFSLTNPSVKPAVRSEAAFAKEFPVSSGSQHRKKEGDGAYGEWVPVDKKNEKTGSLSSSSAGAEDQNKDNDCVFPEASAQPVDITLAISERAVAQKRLAENPFDINAMCMLNRAQEQVDAWAQSNTIPGLFTGSTGAQVLSSEELSNSGPQAWIKKQVHCRRGFRPQGLTIAYLE
ncbi:serine/arginine repetitive matrix protein 5 isoform X2 [Hoplias malabaricus]|uniref:serine/arginine repetitive matrix protein 5 isoform X2 n=1 Tax=Hoplias malabaricus TaxID=27720 RepID=UPI003461A407